MKDLRIQPLRVRAPLVKMGASHLFESPLPVAHCLVCGKKGKSGIALRCTECKATLFCSRVCREAHVAQTLATLEEPYRSYCTSRDGELTTTEFLFPCSGESPCHALQADLRVMRRRVTEHGHAIQALDFSSHTTPQVHNSKESEGGVNASYGSLGGGTAGHSESAEGGEARLDSGYLTSLLDTEYSVDHKMGSPTEPPVPFVELDVWEDYYALRGLRPGGPVAEALCLPLTVYRIATRLCKSTRAKLARGEKVVVHYLGPEEEPLWLRAFQEIGCLLQRIDHNKDCLPACPTGLSSTEAAAFKASIERRRDSALYDASTVTDSGDSCTSMASAIARAQEQNFSAAPPPPACTDAYEPKMDVWMVGPCVAESMNGWRNDLGSGVEVTMLRGRYDEWLDSGLLPQADLIVALNCGLAIYANWEPTLRKLKETSTPTFFTDYSVACCNDDAEVLTRLGFSLSHPITPNPFQLPFLRKLANNADRHPCSNKCVFGINT